MWDVAREGPVVIATYVHPPMNYYTDAALEQLDGLIDTWLDDDAAVVVLTGGAEGRFITHFDVDEILRNQEKGDSIFEAPKRSRRAQALTRRR